MTRKKKGAPNPVLLKNGRRLWLHNLIRQNRLEEARGYAMMHGLGEIAQGGRASEEGQAENTNASTCADLNLKNISSAALCDELRSRNYVEQNGGENYVSRTEGEYVYQPRRITDENGAVTAGTLVAGETAIEAAERRERERVTLPVFAPAREVLPKGCRWAVVTEHGGVNRLLREVRFEDNALAGALWLTQRQAARGMAPKGKVVAVEWDEGRKAPGVEGAWKLWVRK